MKESIRIAFRDFWHPDSEDAVRRHNPLYRMLSRRFDLELSRHPDFLVYSTFGTEYLRHDCTRIFYTGENVRPDFTECDYAFSFDYPVTERNYRLPLYRLYGYYDRVLNRGHNVIPPAKRKFCNFVYSNRNARERLEFVRLLNAYREVDCGGRLMNNVGGPVRDKLSFLENYKFTIAFENASHPGYTTEKILEALIANTIPIYWGNPLVGRDFNPDCLINCHDFESFEAVVERVRQIDHDDEEFMRYVTAPAFPGDRPNEFVREENIVDRFESIFAGPTRSKVARPADPLRYYVRPDTWRFALRRLGHRLRGATA